MYLVPGTKHNAGLRPGGLLSIYTRTWWCFYCGRSRNKSLRSKRRLMFYAPCIPVHELVKEEDHLITVRHEAANENLAELIINRRPKFQVRDWVCIYDDQSTITGGQHVLKASEVGYRSKKFAFNCKTCSMLNWSVRFCLLVQEQLVVEKRSDQICCWSRSERMKLAERLMPEIQVTVAKSAIIPMKEPKDRIVCHGQWAVMSWINIRNDRLHFI